MSLLKIRTREQQYLSIPFAAGVLAGLAGLTYLFSIPADPKNSLIFGFSLFRLLEGLGLLVGSGVFVVILYSILHEPDFSHHLFARLSWQNEIPWSLKAAWVVFLLDLFLIFFGGFVFPGQSQIFERLSPVILWLLCFLLVFVAVNIVWSGKVSVFPKLLALGKVSLITVAAGLALGLVIFPANIGLLLRQGSLLVLLIIAPVLYFSLKKNRILGTTALVVFLFILFGGALIGVWANGTTDLNIVTGLLPYNDANGYYHGARLLAEGQPLHPFSAKRPLFPAALGVLYAIGGENLQFAIAVLILISILAVFFSVREIQKTSGPALAVFFVFGIFLFIRRFIGSTMSEMLGLPLGVIGFAFLWNGAARRHVADVAAGVLLLSLGLIARAGPLFMLPLLILWAGWQFRKDHRFNWKVAGITTAAAIMGYVIHLVIFYTLAGYSSSSMGNFSYTLYGLVVGGKGWKQYRVDYPEVMNLVEPAYSRAVYLYALDAFKANPLATLQGALVYWKAFFTFGWYGAFGYIEGVNIIESIAGRIIMAILSLAGLITASINYKRPVFSMVLAGVTGIILSVPFVPTLDAEIRTYAASIPWFIGLAMLGLWGIFHWPARARIDRLQEPVSSGIPYGLWSIAGAMVILVSIAPLLVHGLVRPMQVPALNGCSNNSARIVTMISRGSYINLKEDTEISQSMVPNLRYSDFNISLHDSPMYNLALQMFQIKTGYSTFNGYNLIDRKIEKILGKTELFEENQGWVELCGWREADSTETGFFHVETARKLTP